MTFFEDFKLINQQVMKKSLKSMSKNWMIIFTGLAYSIINVVIYGIIFRAFMGPFRLIAGILGGFITASLISNYLYLLYNVIFYDRISLDDFKQGFSFFLRKVYSVLILAWIASYFLGVFGLISAKGAFGVSTIAGLLIFIFLNALPETIYQKHYAGMDIIGYALDFIKDNFLNWFIPVAILSGLLYLVTGELVVDVLSTNLSFSFGYMGLGGLARYLIGQFIFSFMMIYRGHLFNILSTSTRRKREFMSNFED